MPSNPSSKWFWNDWDNDKALHLCSFAAQGLWMRMLSIAARAIPLGYVTINGRPADATDLAQLTGKSEAEVRCLVDELEGRGVFSRDRHHRIYNRRMVRDARRQAASIKHGKEGGNPEIRRGTVPKAQRIRPYRRSDNPAKTLRIFERDGGKCHWCGVELAFECEELVANFFHVDHVIAICDGGGNEEANLVAACAACNHKRARVTVGSLSDVTVGRVGDGGAMPLENKEDFSDNNPDNKAPIPLNPIPNTLKKEKKSSPVGERKEKPTRLPDGFVVSEEWKRDGEAAAAKLGKHPDIEVEAELFANHEWRRTHTDWHRTWINWCLNAKSSSRTNGNGQHKLSPGEKLFLGFAQAAEGDFGADSETTQPLLDRRR